MVQGLYQHKPELPFVPGLEAAGEIIELGGSVMGYALGDAVIIRMRIGAYAEEAVVPMTDVMPLPAGFSFAEGATFLVAHITSWHGLATRGQLKAGETLLVLGAAGGVGLAGVEIGKALGARVIAVASSEAKRAAAMAKGADAVIDPADGPLSSAVKAQTGGRGADVILDPVGLQPDEATRCLAIGGRLLIVGFAGGNIPAYPANRILLKSGSLIGVRAGEAARHDPALRAREMKDMMAHADGGRLKPYICETFPLASYARAMRTLMDRKAIGRVALTMD
jgi:NADPH2:quinone reductase